jgi:hypothetical protein
MRRLLPFLLLLAACTTQAAPTTPAPDVQTALAPLASPTPSVAATLTPEPGFTLLPATPLTPIPLTNTPTPCENNAEFISDLTVPDFTQVVPGAVIDKRWQIRNTGACDWGPGYRVVFFEGNSMNAAAEHALYPAKAGNEAVVQIAMTAPPVPGDYTGRWQLRDEQGKTFGQVLFIKITVIGLSSPTPGP